MSSTDSQTILYKILTESEYTSLYTPSPPSDRWSGSALDLKDGFIHTSSSTQLAGTLSRFFGPEHTVVHLLLIPRSQPRIETTLKFDMASHGEEYGHLYEGLDLGEEVKGHVEVRRGENGAWAISELEF